MHLFEDISTPTALSTPLPQLGICPKFQGRDAVQLISLWIPFSLYRSQFALLFRVADTSKRGLVSWEDFIVFETLLKRPDADYWMAFQYFDV